jgi:hypothetical protein
MGRGLSDLQRYILTEAGKRPPIDTAHQVPETQLNFNEILEGFFGWRAKRGILNFYHFSKLEIGEKKYRSVMAALSRSLARLEQRGLVEIHRGHAKWTRITITDQGREWLSVNTLSKWDCVNR